jgi:ATP-dependent DNA helicase RecG
MKFGDNKIVITIHVKAEIHAPYTYDGRAWQRDESQTNRMSQHKYEQLIVERGQLNHAWEESMVAGYEIDDLDQAEIYRAVEQGITVNRVPASVRSSSIKDILTNWNLLKEDGKLNNAAAVLFAKKVLPHYLQCHIKLGRFRGTDMLGDFIDNKDFYGNAFQMLEEANQFMMRHLPIASFFEPDRFERIDKPALPVLAVREALVNAICHRDYSNRSSAITLAIFDDRMEIWNNGQLPQSLKIADLKKKHQSDPRNKIIAKVFYDRKYFDGWGTGVVKIFDLCRENDIPEPEYQEYSGGIEVTFKFKEHIGITRKTALTQHQLNARQEAILQLIKKHGAIGVKKIMFELVDPPSQRMVSKDLNFLRETGLIELRGHTKTALWSLKKMI